MRPLGFLHILVASIFITAGCSTPDTRRSTEPDPDSYDSNAHPAAYGMESAFLGKTQKVRPANDFQFYYKNCTQTDNRSYYSKTSYWCNDR
jgi:hypothetical protein